MHVCDIWSADVRQAYLQSDEQLSPELFSRKPVPEFELRPEECIQMFKPLYGLYDSRDLWHRKIDDQQWLNWGMNPFPSDPDLYKLMSDGILMGLIGRYIDDLLRAYSSSF